MISFIVPAHDEECFIGDCLASIHRAARATGQPYEIIVVDDASTDRTAWIARQHGATVLSVQHRQISATRNAGAKRAKGDVLFFVDADTLANAAAVNAGLLAVKGGAVGGGCVFRFDRPLPLWAKLFHTAGVLMGRYLKITGGCFLFCTRASFGQSGGFSERQFAGEEIDFQQKLKRHGRVVIVRPMVTTSGRKLSVVSVAEIGRLTWRYLIHGLDGFTSRDGLDAWYGPMSASCRRQK